MSAADRDGKVAAHLELADEARARGELALALSHYERALAWDLDHPRASALAAALRADLAPGRRAQDPGETLALPRSALGPIASRYRLLRELGRGGAGTVYLAEDLHLERRVAIKVLHRAAAGADPGRDLPEARLVGALSHPGVVRILDLDASRGVVVMEHLAGGSLRDRLEARAAFPARAVRRLARGVLETLEVVHGAGVVHGDLKPANLLFRHGGDPLESVVVADFGVATAHASTPATPGPEGAAPRAGTLGYAAPELQAGNPGDARADLYALGILLRECLLGASPFDRAALLAGEAAPLTPLPEGTSEELAAALESLCAAAPGDRPASAHEALARFA
ncbi:MAG: serine/threonine-protein kinase [Deltaproteobacteria bacterium]|nr:serine/threonine-protein kinase [Deltaproteobacteria bacterium]